MTEQLSDCCKAEIVLTGQDRPNAYACNQCGRIIGIPMTTDHEEQTNSILEYLINEVGSEPDGHLICSDVRTTDELCKILRPILNQQFTQAHSDWQRELVSKINMIILGIKVFQESEKQRDIEEKQGNVRRDGGRTLAAFSLINSIQKELETLSQEGEKETT